MICARFQHLCFVQLPFHRFTTSGNIWWHTEIDSLYGKKSNEIKKRVKMASKDDVANDDTIEIDVKPMAASTTEEDELDWLDEQI